ncbi:MAG: hypothetical protein H6739_24850 [Alphaproteobacteria bacterium]|nr:hypothetical protein [Alphaproteobacteria bacterium]
MTPRLPLLALLAALAAVTSCSGRDEQVDSNDNTDICGDIDGDGTDTGDVPNLLGNWTSDFGANLFRSDCGLEGFNAGSETFIDGAMEVRGRIPNQLYVVFGNEEDERFFGLVSNNGGVSFSGIHEDTLGTMYGAFGGLSYYDTYRNRTVMEGFAFIGVDVDGDGTIDCSGRGEWTAYKSGA